MPDYEPTVAQARRAVAESTVAEEVIPRLLQRRRPHPVASPAADAGAITDLADIVARRDLPTALTLVQAVRGRGATLDALLLDLLAGAARHLGVLWEEDLCDFTQVTVGVSRLHTVMRELSVDFRQQRVFRFHPHRLLLSPAPGEQHTFGLAMVGEFFNRGGWEVQSAGDPGESAVALVRHHFFTVAAFSIGGEAKLDTLAATLSAVRKASCNPRISIMVGGPMLTSDPSLVAALGADAMTLDAVQAVAQADVLAAGQHA